MEIKQRHIYLLKRRANKIPLKNIAASVGISVSALAQYERGDAGLKLVNLQAYRDYIDKCDNGKEIRSELLR